MESNSTPYFYFVRNYAGAVVSPIFEYEHQAQTWIDGLWIDELTPDNTLPKEIQ